MTFQSDDDNDDNEPNKRRRINATTATQPSRFKREVVCNRSQEKRMKRELGEDQVHIIEVFSPSRVNKISAEAGLTPGDSFDLQTVDPDDGMPWDFNKESKRRKAFEIIKRDRSKLIIGSPCCTEFPILQNLNKGKVDVEQRKEKMKEAIRHLRFVCDMYRCQSRNRGFFLHEHPLTATSWKS